MKFTFQPSPQLNADLLVKMVVPAQSLTCVSVLLVGVEIAAKHVRLQAVKYTVTPSIPDTLEPESTVLIIEVSSIRG